jgi:exopolyphosphatase/guanosine-5'-triphosphate,3'-diphosphate pyrophosphatase
MSKPRRVAAIDCGTNSLRLLIADIDLSRGELVDLHRRMEIVRLGQGVDATRRLAPEALARTFAMLEEYAKTISDSGAGMVRLVATSATRDAANADEFAAGVRRILGIDPEVVSGAEEAYLSFFGATAELTSASGKPQSTEPPFLVVDIGGGSTEFVLGQPRSGDVAHRPVEADRGLAEADRGPVKADHGLQAMSMDIGCVRLTERHLRADPPTQSQVAAATADVDAALAAVAAAMPVASARTLVGLAGSVTTLTAVALDLPEYDAERVHHARISAERVREVTARLLSISHDERASIGAIHPGRVDVIGAGSLILDRIMTTFDFAEFVASEHDILDGIAWSMVVGSDLRSDAPPWS